jgi:hypothetical protein
LAEDTLITLDELNEFVRKTLSENRIGRPVALRLHAYLSADHGELIPRAADLLDITTTWFGSDLIRLDARGSVADGQITVLAEFALGQTALVVHHLLRDGPPRVDFFLFGTLGMVEHEALAGAMQEPVVSARNRPRPDRLSELLGRSLEHGSPVAP